MVHLFRVRAVWPKRWRTVTVVIKAYKNVYEAITCNIFIVYIVHYHNSVLVCYGYNVNNVAPCSNSHPCMPPSQDLSKLITTGWS